MGASGCEHTGSDPPETINKNTASACINMHAYTNFQSQEELPFGKLVFNNKNINLRTVLFAVSIFAASSSN